MRKPIIYLFVLVLLLGVPSGIRYLHFYGFEAAEREAPQEYQPANISQVPTPAASSFLDEPTVGKGFVLLDMGHRNNFELSDIAYLDGRLAARGFELINYQDGELAAALRQVSAFVVIAPMDPFSGEELQTVSDFVGRGGRLLLLGDPTRFNLLFNEEDVFDYSYTIETDEIPLNSLANEFDIIFKGDYLYNTFENEGNFRNIILPNTSISDHEMMAGLEKLVFYGAHSIQVGSSGTPLLTGDDNTWSSDTDRAGGLTLAASSADGRVLALGDLHFMMEPYYTVYDNGRFAAAIADFLTETADRQFVLADFPYFFQRDVNLIYTGSPELGPDAFDEIIALQEGFRSIGQTLNLAAEADEAHDTLYLGLYNQSEEVTKLLSSAGISLTIEPPLLTEAERAEVEDEADEPAADQTDTAESAEADEAVTPVQLIESAMGSVRMSGTTLILLDEQGDQRQLVLLAASNDGLENSIDRLLALLSVDAGYGLSDCLLQGRLALCPSDVPDEEVEAELDTGNAPEATEPEATPEPGTGDEDDADGAIPPEPSGDEVPGELQGSIAVGETIEGTIIEGEAHNWLFTGGPANIDVTVSSGEMDLVLQLYDPAGELMDTSDSGFSGESESLLGIEIPDDGEYLIQVRDFFEESGGYTLTVSAAETIGEATGAGVFIFADDDGEPLSSGYTSLEGWTELLGSTIPVTTWIASVDGPLEEDSLTGYDLVIWDSGDYRDESGFLNNDTVIMLDYLDTGGKLIIVGSSPTILGESELSTLVDIEVAGADSALLDGFEQGEIVELDQAYQAVTTDLFDPESDPQSTLLFVRGPDSSDSGSVMSVASFDESQPGQMTIVFLAPLSALPSGVQSRLVDNFMSWFGFGGG